MQTRIQGPSRHHTHRSEIDRLAINAVCHLLFGAIWLERRVATQLVTVAENSDGRRVGAPESRTIASRSTGTDDGRFTAVI